MIVVLFTAFQPGLPAFVPLVEAGADVPGFHGIVERAEGAERQAVCRTEICGNGRTSPVLAGLTERLELRSTRAPTIPRAVSAGTGIGPGMSG